MQPPGQAESNRVGKYHIVDRLAVGGMAEVFLACEKGSEGGLDRLVVIKRILPHLATDDQFVEMFLREARIAARIHHQNVVQIYELGESNGYPFIAMEYVPGSSLKQLIKASRTHDTRITLGAALHLACQACAGAHAAHELKDGHGKPYGLVHRDISPHNLMVTDEGFLKLLDFGIAKASEGMDNTRTGLLKGKISYMSPEQARQDRLDRRSDVFSLGIVTWELLAGTKPFQASSELATMQAIVTGERGSLREARSDAPPELEAVLDRALQLDPEDRWPTADAMRRALRDAAGAAEIDMDPDRAALLVRTLLGDRHDQRKRAVEVAMERTLVSLTAAPPASVSLDPADPDATRLSQTGSLQTTTGTDPRGARAAFLGGGVLAGAGAILGGLGIVAAIVGIGVAAWMVSGPDEATTDAWTPPPMPPLEGEPVRMSIAPVSDAEPLRADFEPIRLYLQRTLKRPFEFEVATTYGAAADALLSGEADYAFLPHNTTRQTAKRADDLQVLAVKEVDGSDSTDGYLVVRRDEEGSSVDDFVGRTICYTDELSNTGYKLPRAYIRDAGLDPDEAFEPFMSGNHEQILHDLLADECALAGTHSASYTTADQRGVLVNRLKILAITGTTPHDAIVTDGDADPELTAALAEALLALDPEEHAGTASIGKGERITGFNEPPPDYADDDG